MDIDDEAGGLELALETADPLLQHLVLLELSPRRIGFGPAFPGGKSREAALSCFAPPLVQKGRVQALPSQQGADLAGLRTLVRFADDALLVLGGETAASGRRSDFGVWPASAHPLLGGALSANMRETHPPR